MFHNSRCLLVFLVFDNPFGGHRKPKYPLQTGMTTLDSYQLNLVQKTQEILCNALKSSDRVGFQRMNDYSICCFCKGAEFHVNIFSLFFFASFAPLRETCSFPVYSG
jgi:hypothetical protein